jgi:AMMECR1 domain-containing protein
LEPIAFQSEQELLAQIRQGVDGLLLEEGPYRGTLLPSVWEDIPEPCDFLRRLKQKAGLSANYWSNTLTVKRYTTFCFG